jgi:purine-binding chemotaxis protein CheW
MTMASSLSAAHDTVELITFNVGDSLYGVDINKVLGINKVIEITPVAQSPEYIRGLLNLRGQIISIVDVGIKLGLPSQPLQRKSRAIIVKFQNELIGLQVDSINDVITPERKDIEPPPPNMGGIHGEYFEGVVKTAETLVGIINMEAVLQMSEADMA